MLSIPYGRQEVTGKDVEAVVAVLKSSYLTQGPVVPEFEKTVSHHCKSKYAVATNSATSALHIACLALDLKSGDRLWTSPISFVASANCGICCGAEVDFVDIDPTTYNLSPQKLEEKLVQAEKIGKLPKIVVPVHMAGQSCEMEEIFKLGQKYGFNIIEDASHAIGGKYKGNSVGCGKYSDITIFSFHPVKIITTAEGGMALTNKCRLAEKMARLRSHGITSTPELMTKPIDGAWYYEQIELGYNYRMTELQAVLGCSQMKRLDQYVKKRNKLAKNYDEQLAMLPISLPKIENDIYSSYHLYIIKIDNGSINISRKHVFDSMRKKGIGVQVHYIPIHTQPYYKSMGFKPNDFPNAMDYYKQAISIPLYPTLSNQDQDYVIESLKNVLEHSR
jgi:UDP-4-amino-4,6-dideoxy-N-acetyl-beta-L-altrosamine transaminase